MAATATIRNKRVMRKFHDAGAIGSGKAVAAEDMGLKDNMIMERFVRAGFLARVGEKYYIPEEFTKTRRYAMMFGKNKQG